MARRTPGRWPLLQAGDLLVLAEADHCNGRGELRIRVTHVPRNADLLSLLWVRIAGVEILPDGSEGLRIRPLCRVAAIRSAEIERNPDERR